MARFLLSFLVVLSVFSSAAQKDSVRKYLDADLHFTTKKDFVYAAMAVKNEEHWVLYAVYPDTAMLLKVYFKDAALTVKDGPFILYYPKKIIAQTGNFTNNAANGHWQSRYPDGQIKNEGDIINNHLSGIWKAWYQNGHIMSERSYIYSDSLAGQPVHQNAPAYRVEKVLDDFLPEGKLQGATTTWYENGNKESAVNYHNDSLTGICCWFRENGYASSKEVYTNGKVTDLECYDEQGKFTGATCAILKQPVLIHPVFDAQDYIIDELHKEKHKDIKQEGEAAITFTVTGKGTVANLVIVSSPDAALSKHIVNIVAGMPPWSPAVTHNRITDYTVKLLIPYYNQ